MHLPVMSTIFVASIPVMCLVVGLQQINRSDCAYEKRFDWLVLSWIACCCTSSIKALDIYTVVRLILILDLSMSESRFCLAGEASYSRPQKSERME